MLSVTVQVTKTPEYLEQIANLMIHNTGTTNMETGECIYEVFLDGTKLSPVYHRPADGWADLVARVLTENGLATQQREEKSTGAGYKLDYE